MAGSPRRSVSSVRFSLNEEENEIVDENVNRLLTEMGLTRLKRTQTSLIAQKSCGNLTRVAYEKHYRGTNHYETFDANFCTGLKYFFSIAGKYSSLLIMLDDAPEHPPAMDINDIIEYMDWRTLAKGRNALLHH